MKPESSAGTKGEDVRQLLEEHAALVNRHPEADPDNIRHTLLLLRLDPLSRLRLSLTRGRAFAAYRS